MAGLFSFSLSKKSQPSTVSAKIGANLKHKDASSSSLSSSPGVFSLFQESLAAEEKEQEEAKKKGVLQSVRLSSKGIDRRHLIHQQKALQQDSSVFSYDEVFEDISSNASGKASHPKKKIFLGYVENRKEEYEDETTEAGEKEDHHLQDRNYADREKDNMQGGEQGREEEEESLHGDSLFLAEEETGTTTNKKSSSSSPSSSAREKYGGNLSHGLNIMKPADVLHRRNQGGIVGGSGREVKSIGDKKDSEEKEEGSSAMKLPPSQFISKLVLSAKRRELEREIVEERQLKKEREGTKNDEVFVTSAYKQRLEERRLLQLELEKQELRDQANSADKQEDLTSFHSHLLRSGHASRYGGGGGEEGRKRREEGTTRTGWDDGLVVASSSPSSPGKEQDEQRQKMTARIPCGDPSSSLSDGVHQREEVQEAGSHGRRFSNHVPGVALQDRSSSSQEAGRSEEGDVQLTTDDRSGGGGDNIHKMRENKGQKNEERQKEEEEREKGEATGAERGPTGVKKDNLFQGKRLSDLLEERKRMKQKALEESLAPLKEDKIAEARRRYLERKRKIGSNNSTENRNE
ncbi:nuclear speckle splicing regulatory protein 1 [Cystoisospora suis]|uniref:Nuclear speckle splicing regulatory protein 1 n=1 Tax=Cystoisospora suis TaxID=483139 RepID=A0A2C6L7M0_9APIC|nr:nuclear speckle splicing regulatory protein 1 [Cystoisospora suis]